MSTSTRAAILPLFALLAALTPMASAQAQSTSPTTRQRENITPLQDPLFGPSVKPWDNTQPLTTIAFGSCIRQNRPQPIWSTINTQRPDLFLFLGDNIYGDSTDMGILRAKYNQLLQTPGFKQLRQATTCLAIWDDHDFGQNDAGEEFPAKRDAQVQFHNFWGLPESSPLRKQDGVYSAHTFGPEGKRVQVLLLDTRFFRSPLLSGENSPFGRYLPNNDPNTTILGPAQWAWLEQQLKSPANVRIIASSIQVLADGHRYEKWGNHPHERTRLLNLLDTASGTVVILSGDRHSGEFSKVTTPSGRELYDLTSSALNQGTGRGDPNAEPNPLRIGNRINVPHYGHITLNWSINTLTFELRDQSESPPNPPLVSTQIPLVPPAAK